jgi:bacteriorhodopsin
MTIRNARRLLWWVVGTSLVLTWLPYFGIFNAPLLIVGLPQPLALTLACNVILTLCVFAIYPLYFKPMMRALNRKPLVEEQSGGKCSE